jgi:uncharacterized protein YceK
VSIIKKVLLVFMVLTLAAGCSFLEVDPPDDPPVVTDPGNWGIVDDGEDED